MAGDHPRVCGEQQLGIKTEDILDGSPPRVRGTEIRKTKDNTEVGITPACAGNSYPLAIRRQALKDHPRVCGEQNLANARHMITSGSPPRVRGTVPR